MEFLTPGAQDFLLALPELFMAAMVLVVLMVTAFAKGSRAATINYWVAQTALLGCFLLLLFVSVPQRMPAFAGMYVADLFGSFVKLVIVAAVAVVLQYGRAYMSVRQLDSGEYYLLTMTATLGMMILASAGNFVSIYLGLELMSLSLYALVSIDRDNARSTEAGMKYFILGALASGLLLYGISMIYGSSGTLEIAELAQRIYERNADSTVLVFGLVFVLAGMAFKLGVVPFHMWVPDVYHGAPSAVTLLVSSAPKIAAFAMAFRVLVFGLYEFAEKWQLMLMVMAIGSIVVGNLAAIAQTNIKRMLAYSGISHMGFMLLALLAGVVKGEGSDYYPLNAYSTALFYAVSYVLMTLASFGMVVLLSRRGFEAEEIDDFRGLNQRSPWFAGMMLIVMFSMAGIPFFVGFWAKLSVLQAVVAANYTWLAVLAVVMSVVGAFYYLRVVKVMYFDDAVQSTPLEAGAGLRVVLSVNALLIAVVGLRPDSLMQICAYTLLH